MNIAFIPIDNRPVCYLLPKQIADINDEINLILPERKFLGGLTEYSNVDEIFKWLENLKDIDIVVMCLDTIAYGGLISSRRCNLSFEETRERIFKLKKILEEKNAKIYAFSSIMRISNNNVNQEEKEYWAYFGKKIFEYSYNFHKNGKAETDVPKEILEDYLKTRKRNFEINKIYLEWQKAGFFDTLVFSKDDCAEFGLNVMEAQELERLGGFVKTGADEIPMTLLARAVVSEGRKSGGMDVWQFNNSDNSETSLKKQSDTDLSPHRPIALSPDTSHTSIPPYLHTSLKVAPIFLAPEYKHLISNYEDVSIEKSVLGQLELAGCEVVEPNDADILLYVNNFEDHQGEIVMKVPTKPFDGDWKKPTKTYLVADVRFANGSDNTFVEKLFETGFDENFLSYSAWNTSANTLGSLICQGVISEKLKVENGKSNNFQFSTFNFQLIITRFLDDWAYQANVRQMLDQPDPEKCKELMKPFEERLWKIFDVRYNVNYKFPWNRLFEVEIELS